MESWHFWPKHLPTVFNLFSWIYSSTLAYIVDANVGRSSTAVATNSFCRGVAGFIAAELAVPLQVCLIFYSLLFENVERQPQNALGDGGLYTLWAGIMALSFLMILLTIKKGGEWREEAIERERRESE